MQHTAGPLRSTVLPLAIALALLSFSSPPASAGNTYYLATNGSDSNPGTSTQPWGTFAKAWTVLVAGDTLVVKNGRYYQSINPRISGASGSPIVIRAENDGGAILDGGGTRSGIALNSNPTTVSYITIEGFRIENCGERPAVEVISPDGTALSSQTNHIVIRRTGARGDAVSTNNAVWSIARIRDSLLEDVWGWGDGRYTVLLYGCTRVTVRRGVFRWDGWGAGASSPQDPKFNMGVYDTHDSLIENVLLIDAASDPYGGDKGGLYVPGNSNGTTAPYGDSDNNTFKGVISLNNSGVGLGVEGGSGGTNDNNRFENVISWGNSRHGATVPRKASGTVFNHVTVAFNNHGFYFGGSGSSVSGTTLSNSIIYSNPPQGINGPAATSYNIVFGNGTDYVNGATPGPNSLSQDPLLDCRVFIEEGSPAKGTASDGGDRGATVLKRYVDGQLTAVDLWPWPYQDRIRTDLCESETRGLCDPTWASLTEYVRGCPDVDPPPPPPPTTFQQGLNGYTGVTDTWINPYDPNLSFNGETKLNVQGTEDIKALVRFDLSALPAGTRITSATLSLYNYAHASSANGGTVSVYPVGRSWIDSQATWNQASAGNPWTAAGMQAGTDYRTSPVTSITIDTASGVWRDFDATAIVQGWLDGTFPNHGFVVRSPTRGAKPLFYSSGYTGNPALRPRLTIVP